MNRLKTNLVDGGPVPIVHLVELVDAADAHVGQHQSAAFETQLVGDGISHDRGCETHA